MLAVIAALALVGVGAYAGARFIAQPRIVQVDRRIVETVPVPGETRVVTITVPGPTRRVEVPVEVTRIVEMPGRDRIVTVTQPVEVPVEVVRREWPQTITVAVGAVLTKEYGWATPAHQDLVIGQVAPGAYAVPEQEGWRVESVTTETRTQTDPARWHIEVRPTIGVGGIGGAAALLVGATIEASRDHYVVAIAGGQSTAGPWGFVSLQYRF